MGSFQNPVGSQPNDPYERYRVEAIEREKQAKEDQERKGLENPQKNMGIAAQLLQIYRRFIEYFEDSSEKGISKNSEKLVRENLLQFKAFLDILKAEDRSQDIEYLNQLSKLWESILVDALQFKRDTPLALQFKNFIKKIQSYPPNQEHSFGYYLTEHAGGEWIPFPYMELIARLHAEHRKDPLGSALESWTALIENLITSFVNID